MTERPVELGGDVKQAVRWWVAGLVTVLAFAAPTWICGTIILRTVMKDPNVRWGIATALGLAVAALAALWGHSFATAGRREAAAGSGPGTPPKVTRTGPGDVHNEISGGDFHGPVNQTRDFSGPISAGTTPPGPDPDSGE